MVHPIEALRACGGRAGRAELDALGVDGRALRGAVAAGGILRPRRGRYRLTSVDTAVDTAHLVTGVLSHRSAALEHGLEVATVPELPEVTVRRSRALRPEHRSLVVAHYRDLPSGAVDQGVTTLARTIRDCAHDLAFPEALAVADSALRQGEIDIVGLRRLLGEGRGPGTRQARLVAAHASPLAANPFESVVRALAIESGLDVVPQHQVAEVGIWGQVDLADRRRRLVIEAESFTHHASRKGFRKDVRRYTEFEVFGWSVLRVTWEDATLQQAYVRWALTSWRLRHDRGLTPPPPPEHLPRLA